MKAPVVVLPLAVADMEAIQAYIEQHSRDAAERFEVNVGETVEGLREFPESNRLLDYPGIGHRKLRRAIIRGFPNHLLLYDYDGQTIRILRAFHAAQDWVWHLITDDV